MAVNGGGWNPDWAGMYVGLAAIKPRDGCLWIAASLDDLTAIHPDAVGPKWSLRLLSFAFMESLCIYGLVIALAILFANEHTCQRPRAALPTYGDTHLQRREIGRY